MKSPRSDALRESLLTAAAEVFAESGYDGARVQEIAERAGVTTGAIYNRFSGKSELLLEALERHTTSLVTELAAAELSVADVLAMLGATLVTDAGYESTLLLESFMAARREPEVAERLRPRLADDRGRLAKLVDEAKSSGEVNDHVDTAAVVTFCQAVALGMHMLRTIDAELPGAPEWDRLITQLVAAIAEPADKL